MHLLPVAELNIRAFEPKRSCIGETLKTLVERRDEYFSQLGRKMANKLSVPSTTFTATSLIPSSAKSFFLKPISLDEVFHQLKGLNPAKSTKSDSPPIKYIKLAASVIASPLTNLFNRCIETGTYPDAFKTAEVIAVYKSGDKFTCSNFRPISLISPFSKIFEKCIYKQLYHYFTSRDILYKHQHGFRKNHSTELAVSLMCDSIIGNLENNNTTCAIFLDLAKAFDTVNHQILLSKLYAYGIRGIPFKLMQSYLSNRKQCTVINKVKSSSHGVPQGSTLGPLLFLIYINDLPKVSNLKVRLFADDAIFTLRDKDEKNLQHIMNDQLTKIDDWMKINQLTINYKKTNFMIFTRKKKISSPLSIRIGQNIINHKTKVKYLGVVIDEKMSWKNHVNYLCSKLAKGCWAISKLRNYVDHHTSRILYYSLIYPHLQYCISSWGRATKNVLKPLSIIQKRVLRLITKTPYRTPSAPLFFQLKILKIDDVYKLQIAKMMHHINNQNNTGTWTINNSIKLEKLHNHNT